VRSPPCQHHIGAVGVCDDGPPVGVFRGVRNSGSVRPDGVKFPTNRPVEITRYGAPCVFIRPGRKGRLRATAASRI
jgi:hypothetical protein